MMDGEDLLLFYYEHNSHPIPTLVGNWLMGVGPLNYPFPSHQNSHSHKVDKISKLIYLNFHSLLSITPTKRAASTWGTESNFKKYWNRWFGCFCYLINL
jgi:hypothetical protein